MSNNGLEMKITADVTDLQTKSAVAKAEYTAQMTAMRNLAKTAVGASEEMKSALNAQMMQQQALVNEAEARWKGYEAQIRESAVVTKEATSVFGKINESFRVTGDSVENLHARLNVMSNAFGAFSELVMAGMGVDYVGEQVKSVAELGESYAQLTEKTGATTQQLAALKLAAAETNTDFSMVGNGLRQLGQNMQMALVTPSSHAAEAFKALGIGLTDSTGHMLPVIDIAQEVMDKLSGMADGAAKTALAGDILGSRFGSQLIPVIDSVGGHFQEFQDKAQSLGLVMSQQEVDASEQFSKGLADLEAALIGVKTEIVGPLLPALADIETAMKNDTAVGGEFNAVADTLSYGLRAVVDVSVAVGTAFGDLFTAASTLGHTLGDVAVEVVAAGEALSGHFELALQTAKNGVDDLTASYEHFGNVFMANEKLFTSVDTGLFGTPAEMPAMPEPIKPDAPTLAPNVASHTKSHLASTTGAIRAATNEQTQIVSAAAQAQKQIVSSQYEAQVADWDAEVAQGKMTKAQEIEDEIAAKDKIYQTALSEKQKEEALDTKGSLAQAKALDDMAVMTASHDAEIARMHTELINQQITDTKKLLDEQNKAAAATQAAWQKAFQPISQAFDSSINGVMQGTETLQQAELKAAQSIALAFIDAEAKKLVTYTANEAMILATTVRSQLGQLAAVQAGVTAQTAAKAAGVAQGRALDVAVGTAQISGDAAKAAAGAYAAVVGIPYVGPVLAPVAAATAYAGVMAFDVLSAEGGMVIPSGVNPLTQLHEEEMVLPAHIAQPLQNMIAGGSTNNSVSSAGDMNFHQTNHFGGGGVDEAMLARAGQGFMNQLLDLSRNGTLRLPGRG